MYTLSRKDTMPMRSRPAANCPVKTFAAAFKSGQEPVTFMELDRSRIIMITESRREAFPRAATTVVFMLNHLMKMVGTVVLAVTVTLRRLALLGSSNTWT